MNTLNEIKNLTQKRNKDIATKLNESQKTIVEKFDQAVKTAEIGASALQSVKGKCEGFFSFISFGLRKDCFGYDIPDLNPNRVLHKTLGADNVKTSLRGVIRLIDPNDDVEDLKINGTNVFWFSYFALNTKIIFQFDHRYMIFTSTLFMFQNWLIKSKPRVFQR